MLFLYAIIIVSIFVGAFVMLKKMFPKFTYLFDAYLVFWIFLLVSVGAIK